jgi:3-phenylpropionate/cinnamic acid dioxygenase small subunit
MGTPSGCRRGGTASFALRDEFGNRPQKHLPWIHARRPRAPLDVQQLLVVHDVEQFLYHEAQLLDERHFREWLDLFTDDARYWMPIRRTRFRGEENQEFTRPDEHSYFDDDKGTLTMRIDKLDTGFSWSEDPPSRTRHIVTNVRVRNGQSSSEVVADCYFLVYRSRLNVEEDMWVGTREDTLRKVNGHWKIAGRKIFLDQVVLQSKNLSSFF